MARGPYSSDLAVRNNPWRSNLRIRVPKQKDGVKRIAKHPDESNRSIGRAIGLAANTVNVFRRACARAFFRMDAPQELGDDQWCKIPGTHDLTVAKRKLAPNWDEIHEQMRLADATFTELWSEFRKAHPDGIGITQLHDGYRRCTRGINISMRRVHEHMGWCDIHSITRDIEFGAGFVRARGHCSKAHSLALLVRDDR